MLNYSFNLGMAISALLVCSVNLIYTFIQGRTDKTQNKIFIVIVCILICNSISGIISAYFGFYPNSPSAESFLRTNHYFYFITHTALCPMFFYYISSISFVSTRLTSAKNSIVFTPFFITELLVLTNMFTGFVWTVDKNLKFQRGIGEMLIYVVALFYYLASFNVLITSWDVISSKRRLAIIFFFILVGIGVATQLVNKDIKVEILTEAVGFTGVMMLVETEDDRMSGYSGFYNRAALALDMKAILKHNRNVELIVLRIKNLEIISRIVGGDETSLLSDIIKDYLKTIAKRYNTYVPNNNTIVMTFYDESPEHMNKIIRDIYKRMDEAWDYEGSQVYLDSVIMVAEVPEQISRVNELFYMTDKPIPSNKTNRIMRGDDLNYIMKRQAIEGALSRGFVEGSYEVYYQPTYHIDKRLHGAEALIRMHDKELGNLYPDEFISVAEQNGLIDEIDDFVLEEVCKFIESGIPQKHGIDNINVNLSVVQCMRPRFVDHIIEIVDRYKVDKSFINFEITESIAAADYDLLSNIIMQLKKEGFLFSMDDYGTGYSNVSGIFSLDLDVIKIDKSLLWGAEKSESVMIILENTIRMIKQMNKKILVEGVETAEQIKLLEKLGVNYLQGYFFSKPIPMEDFLALISRQKKVSLSDSLVYNRT